MWQYSLKEPLVSEENQRESLTEVIGKVEDLSGQAVDFLRAHAIKLTTPDGSDSASVTVETDNPFHGESREQRVPFVLRPGYRRFSFHGETHQNRGTAWVDWANSDEHDATIIIHADCRPLGSARAAVSEVYAVPG